MSKDSPRRLAWITGAGKGIGRALALRLASQGWRIAASARTLEDLEKLAADGPAGHIRPYVLDVTDPVAAQATVAGIEEDMGKLDMVVLNAGTHIPMPAAEFSADGFRKLVDTNLMGTVHCIAPVMTRFLSRGSGHIAVVASVAGYRGLPTSAAYGATKAGLINMCEALYPELERAGVRLTLINPGFVKTPLTDKNTFEMPFLISAEEAAIQINKGLEKRSFERTFPWRFAVLMKILRLLPNSLFFAVTRRMITS
jgi:NAD(P)-dependent dehydrogenase (short-subunit alcohol dehydrogenase family)